MPPIYPPLGVLYMAAMLEKAGHSVEFLDMDIEAMDEDGLVEHVKQTRPQFVGFSCVTPTIELGWGLAKRIKSVFPDVFIAIGGIHATIDPLNTLGKEGVDAICIGESEHTICEMVDRLESGTTDMSGVAGVFFKKDGEIVQNPPREMESDLDSFPFPAFHLIKDLCKYSPPDAQGLPVAPIMTSRGCPGKCTYCCTKQIFGRRFRARSVENIVAEIDLLVTKFGVKEIHFLDDNLSTNRRRILELCRQLKERDYPIRYEISNGIRADMVDEEILRALKGIGMANVGFGVESGNEEILKVIKKGIDKDTVRKAMKMAKDLGFETWGFFILGLYKDTPETIKDTIDFAIELDPDFAKFLILKPFPGSEIFQQLQAMNLIDSYEYAKYGVYTEPVHHLPDLTAAEIFKWQKYAFRKFYFRPSKILSHIKRISTFEQLKIAFKGLFFVLARVSNRRK
jgi:radical SAM superfamily enzyme YgiQ (UPF0313 family)